ncbi:MAG: hypothetical protein SCH71_06580 [Desulfobulbaceae bacterium]|nr:hypothetical protein [Desulfobulbaceae bacterium]
MSRKNIRVNETSIIIQRANELSGTKNDAQLAKILGITHSSLIARKNNGTLEIKIFEWAVTEKKDLNYLFYGVAAERREYKFKILEKIEQWMLQEQNKDSEFAVWFRIQFEKQFPDYYEWLLKNK